MILSRYTLKHIAANHASLPHDITFDLPEKVLQFGSGLFLRGIPDYYIDKANQKQQFNGRIVVVQTSAYVNPTQFNKQDCLYTFCVNDSKQGRHKPDHIVSSISRVLHASQHWNDVLACAYDPNIQIIISNTTEIGITLVKDDIRAHPPKSYPGKLLAYLYERFKAFDGSHLSGMVIIAMELIPDNAKKLESYILELAHLNGLEYSFFEWIENHNFFCNSLADRTVYGLQEAYPHNISEEKRGYTDTLVTMAESYNLWVIEGNEKIKNILSFAAIDKSIIIQPDINHYQQLMLHLLHGTKALISSLAFLNGCNTIKAAATHKIIASFIRGLIENDMVPSLPPDINTATIQEFKMQLLNRLHDKNNLFPWMNTMFQYTLKIKFYCIPVLLGSYKQRGSVSTLFSLAFASYIHFSTPVTIKDGSYYGQFNGTSYLIQDIYAGMYYTEIKRSGIPDFTKNILGNFNVWGCDLNELPGFTASVVKILQAIKKQGIAIVSKEIIKDEAFKSAASITTHIN